MIRQFGNLFVLDTANTTYTFRMLPSGHPEHLYYGQKIHIQAEEEAEALTEKRLCLPGNTVCYSPEYPALSLEDVCLEMSAQGKGDIREPFLEVTHADGSFTSDFLYEKAEISAGKAPFETLPGSYEENGNVEELTVTLRDRQYDLTLELHYFVFEDYDVISRSAKLINTSDSAITLERLMSLQLDFSRSDWVFSTFHGAWAREMKRSDQPVGMCKLVNESHCGCSSNRANPFVMLSKQETTEDRGECFGFNLIYSGNHYEAVEQSAFGKMRLVTGINPRSFQFHLAPGEAFEAPEAVMSHSDQGFNGMSQNMHRFVRNCIVRGVWKHKPRPVLLNSWEAAYFDINERKLLNLAKAGKEAGIELFVMDDGWFGSRDDDTQALGDWYANIKKLPQGIAGLAKKVNALGLDFGLWVEPEMVNTNSDLYRAHPEWVMEIPGKPHSESRRQRILDLSNPEVVDYMTERMTEVFSSGNVAYVKWDMNRIFSDAYSQYLPPERQKEVAHRYMLGLYRMLDTLTRQFPHILFEGCASGGNRFDLGMLCYFPQIWASDDSDAIYRVEAQTGYSYGYPMSTVTAHVSDCPNHQTLRITPLATRFNVAAFGVLGYECHLGEMSRDDVKQIKEQIVLYKKWRDVLQHGTFYRGRSAGNLYEWTCVSPDRKKAVGMILQVLVTPNTAFETYQPKGLDPGAKYRFTNLQLEFNLKEFGSLVNQVSPIHIRQNSLLHNAASALIKMKGEREDCVATGEMLMNGSVKLKQGFAATGYAEDIRFFKDFASRMYFMEEID
ncbi:MAG: alpha-galactosidase [Oscillospiraceae bacterium]|nr:alpha-galactosidase [Oscillospiraceae bacterium]